MKNYILNLCLLFPLLLVAQHSGNSISRQNISGSQLNSISRQNIVTNSRVHNFSNQGSQSHNLQPDETLTIDLKVLNNVKADSYTAVFNLTQLGKTVEETSRLMNHRVNNVKKQLTKLGVLSEDIVIDVISFVPFYETEVIKKLFSKKYVEVPKGFQLQQNLHIKFKTTKSFDAILATCAKNEIYNLVKVDYFIKDIHLVYKKIQEELIKLVAEKKEYFKALGFDLTKYTKKIADKKYCYLPKNFYKSYQAFNSVSFQAIKNKKNLTSVNKVTSFYYQPLSYESYDLVINSSIVEPVVQVGMDFKLQFIIPRKVPIEAKHKYYLVSPNGNIDVKELKHNKTSFKVD